MLILLRHGRTAANASGLLQGRVDNPLDEVGIAQAIAAARSLGPVDRVVSSPLARAVDTARRLERSSEVELDERLLELDYGEFDGRPIGVVDRDTWERWRRDPQHRLPGGESLLELRARVWSLLEEVAGEAEDRSVVLVSHVSPIKSAVQWALGVDAEISWRLSLATASISRIAVRRGVPVLVSFNETDHHPEDQSLPSA